MLGKLFEASQIMAKLKKKHKEKARGGNLEGMGVERTISARFGYRDQEMLEYQKPRLSVDGSSRDCFEELREAIRESFARQNLLPKTSNEVKAYSSPKTSNDVKAYSATKTSNEVEAYFDRKRSDISLDLPSTSSSQSSIFFSHEFDTSDDFSLSKSIEEKSKAPNVIAKLMGLEPIPPKPLQSNPQKHYLKEKAINQGRMIFDIDLPSVRRPHSTVQKVDPQPRTLDKLGDNLQFKGLVTSNCVDGTEHISNSSDWKKRFTYDAPPIVIIKPLHVSGSLEEGLLRQKCTDQDSDTKKMLGKLKVKERLPLRTNYDEEGALDISENHRKLLVEKSPVKRPCQETGDEDFGDGFAKRSYTSVKHQDDLSSTAVEAFAPVKPKPLNQEVSEETVPKIQRVVANTKKQVEVGSENFRDTSSSCQNSKLASTDLRKSDKGSNAPKDLVSLQKAPMLASVSDCITLTASQSSSVRKENIKNEKQVERQSKIDNVPFELGCNNEQGSTIKGIKPLEQLPSKEKKDTSGNLDFGNNSRSSVYESTCTIQPNNEISYAEDARCGIKYNLTQMKSCNRSNSTRNLLLDSSSFLNHAKELFDIRACQPMVSHIASSNDYGTADNKLLLECAKELLEHKSFQCRVAVHPFPHIHIRKSKICVYLDQLVDEICDGIEYLRIYSKLTGKVFVVNTLSTLLEKDMGCNGLVNGTWEFGWRNGFTLDEIDQIVVHIEQKILSGIIEDVLMDMAI